MHRVYNVMKVFHSSHTHHMHGVTRTQNRLVHVLFQQNQKDKEMTSYLLGQATENWSRVAYKFWMQTHVEIRKKEILLFCLRMRSDEVNRCLDGVNLLCFIVRDLKGKFFLKRHHDLDSVQAIESKVLLEMGSRCHLRFDGETRNWLLMTAQCYEFIITEHSLPLEVQYLILDLVCNTN